MNEAHTRRSSVVSWKKREATGRYVMADMSACQDMANLFRSVDHPIVLGEPGIAGKRVL